MKAYAARPTSRIVEAVNSYTSYEATRNKIQFAMSFQVLQSGCPMVEYEQQFALFEFLNLPNLPRSHWSDTTGWQMSKFMNKYVTTEIKRLIKEAKFIALSVDAVTIVDNDNSLSYACVFLCCLHCDK